MKQLKIVNRLGNKTESKGVAGLSRAVSRAGSNAIVGDLSLSTLERETVHDKQDVCEEAGLIYPNT